MWECLAVRGLAPRSLRNSSAALGDNIYVYGGLRDGKPTSDLMVLNTGVPHPLAGATTLFLSLTMAVLVCVTVTSVLVQWL